MTVHFTGQLSITAWFVLEVEELKRLQKKDRTEFRAGVIKVYVALKSMALPETMIDVSGAEVLDTKINELVQFVNSYKPK